jgi:hypothetical protein
MPEGMAVPPFGQGRTGLLKGLAAGITNLPGAMTDLLVTNTANTYTEHT